MLNNKVILLTGGTGSFGQKFVETVIKKFPKIKKLIIFSRDELKQFEMISRLKSKRENKILRFFLGDIRDKERIKTALKDVDIVVHAAALKQVPAAEYNPIEFIKTNVLGAQNIVEACLETKVTNVISLSTDKASSPINLYGATKLCSDKLFIAANNIRGKNKIKFSVVRYGNVMGSRGSVLPFFLKQKKLFPITDLRMTRFNISLEQSVDMVIWSLQNNLGGEIFVPKLPSFKVTDLARSINSKFKSKIIGIRPGEKLHEELISTYDAIKTVDLKKYYAILANFTEKEILSYIKKTKGKKVEKNFVYNSLKNSNYLSISDLRKEVKNFLKVKFQREKLNLENNR